MKIHKITENDDNGGNWKRQLATDYESLTEQEKDSYRKEVLRALCTMLLYKVNKSLEQK